MNTNPSFTLAQIKAAHSKVTSGADFPQYIRDIHALGVASYRTWVSDGHTDYVAKDGSRLSGAAAYGLLTIAAGIDVPNFRTALVAHQQGKTDYKTFCDDAAACGVASWVTDIAATTCSYYGLKGQEMLVEAIPL